MPRKDAYIRLWLILFSYRKNTLVGVGYMTLGLLTPFLSLIGGTLGTLIFYKILPKTITAHLSENHQQRNRMLLEEIKSDNQIVLESIKNEYQKELEVYKMSLIALDRYSDYQFRLYNELWTSLYELKCKGEDLWEHASSRNLTNFAKQIKETKNKIEQNILLINDEHYDKLINILKTFGKYKIGKENLINYRKLSRDNEFELNFNENDFKTVNQSIKIEYDCLIDMIASDFKRHLSVPLYK